MRTVILFLLGLALLSMPAFAAPVTIVAFGDSLTSGFQIPETEAYPAFLEARLKEKGHDIRVLNAGMPGETTQGGKARINWILRLKPDIVILELGVNDAIRGFVPEHIRADLDEQISRLQQKKVKVILCGMKAVATKDQTYIADFEAMYPELAEKHGITYHPDFLGPVWGKEALLLPDRLHPNPDGMKAIAESLLPQVETLLKQRKAK